MIHVFPLKDRDDLFILTDTFSGSVHLIDRLTQLALDSLATHEEDRNWDWQKAKEQLIEELATSQYSPEEISQTIDELADLIQAGQLFAPDRYAGIADQLQSRHRPVKALCLNVAHTCDLACSYCFAGQGKYHGKAAIMPWSVAQEAIDFLVDESENQYHLDIDFFGGEPLLNWDVVEKTVAYARSLEEKNQKKFRFTFTTNGMKLTPDKMDFLNQQMDNVVLSLDGRKEVHDHFRKTPDGQGSYDTILPHFQEFVRRRGDGEYYLRGTFTKNNADFSNDVIAMANLGFSRLSMEPVIGDPSIPYMFSLKDYDFLAEQYDLLTDEMIRREKCLIEAQKQGLSIDDLPVQDRPFIFYHFILDLEEGPCVQKRIMGCGAGSEYLALTPEGDFYPCHQFVGEEEYSLGSLKQGLEEKDFVRQARSATIYSRQECQSCWASMYCSGGCMANAVHSAGDPQATVPLSCMLFRKRMECALRLKAEKALMSQA